MCETSGRNFLRTATGARVSALTRDDDHLAGFRLINQVRKLLLCLLDADERFYPRMNRPTEFAYWLGFAPSGS